ncbi:hypothetical protein [Beduini massiliensis]|uniref:hypothetical protein n=1 Tax=Beduini massiliensis TaxID=1585974 RepID=UPI00059A88DE|nr:hypothetical protein [Beduini massiliensis]
MKKTKIYLILSIILYISFLSFFHMSDIVSITKEVKDMIINQLFPTLFPFMLIITICQKVGMIQLIAFFLQFISRPLFRVSGNALSIYCFSILSGYPTNAKMISNAYSLKQIDEREADLLVKVAHHGSFSFIVYFVGMTIFHDIRIGFILELAHILPTLIYFLISSKGKSQKMTWCNAWYPFSSTIYQHKIFDIIKDSLKECMIAFIYIFGFMLVCKVSLISLSHLFNSQIILFLNGALEFSSGIILFNGSAYSYHIKLLMSVFYLSFGGLSVFLQVYQLMDHTPFHFKSYLFFRCFHALASTFLVFIYLMN